MDKPFVPVESSNLAQVGYDTATSTLYVGFKHGGTYRYFGVPIEKYTGILEAESAGKYLNAEIKPHHGYEKIDENSASYDLETHQQQLDMDGVMVGVSRQALHEVLKELAYLRFFQRTCLEFWMAGQDTDDEDINALWVKQRGEPVPMAYEVRD